MFRYLLLALLVATPACRSPEIADCRVPCSEQSGCPSGLSCHGGLCSAGSECSSANNDASVEASNDVSVDEGEASSDGKIDGDFVSVDAAKDSPDVRDLPDATGPSDAPDDRADTATINDKDGSSAEGGLSCGDGGHSDVLATDLPLDTGVAVDSAEGEPAQYTWAKLPGDAHDVGVGANGSLWVAGGADDTDGNFGIWQFVDSDWVKTSTGRGVRIAVDANGFPWIINTNGQIFRRTTNVATFGNWIEVTGATANDIGIGGSIANPAVWIVSRQPTGTADFVIQKWNGKGWDTPSDVGGAVRIAVDSNGVPWVVNSLHNIWRRTTNTTTSGAWLPQEGLANDIGVSGADAAGGRWAVSTFATTGGFTVWVWDDPSWTTGGAALPRATAQQGAWVEVPGGGAVAISVGGDGSPVVVDSFSQIFRVTK